MTDDTKPELPEMMLDLLKRLDTVKTLKSEMMEKNPKAKLKILLPRTTLLGVDIEFGDVKEPFMIDTTIYEEMRTSSIDKPNLEIIQGGKE